MYYVRFDDGDILITEDEAWAEYLFHKDSCVSFGKVITDIGFELKGNFADSLEEFDEDGCPVCKEVSDVE